jgi:DNA mismatch endonuclease (patch repair protein)
VRSLLHRRGFRFSLNSTKLPGKPDIVLPKYKSVIFVNGCFWHGHECNRGKLPHSNNEFWSKKINTNKERDKNNYSWLVSQGWNVLVVWTCELSSNKKTANAIDRLQKKLLTEVNEKQV